MSTIGIIGGSGLYHLDGLTDVKELRVDTPFGAPSDVIVRGSMDGTELLFIPRHGRGHRWLPSEVPYRANVWALKKLGAQWLISVSAVGSMREAIAPGDFVLPDQYYDRTVGRAQTFFGEGIAAHVSVAEPTCPTLRNAVAEVIEAQGIRCHRGGTYVCMEGPAFSTRAESLTYRDRDVSVIGMTAMPEVKLAREAQLHYTTIALATDYDCWREAEEAVSADAVVTILKKNTANVKRALGAAVSSIETLEPEPCGCERALTGCVLTDPSMIPASRREALEPILRGVV